MVEAVWALARSAVAAATAAAALAALVLVGVVIEKASPRKLTRTFVLPFVYNELKVNL